MMVFSLFSYWGGVGEISNSAVSQAEKAGASLGGILGTGMLLGIWVIGDIILGLFVMFTRPKT